MNIEVLYLPKNFYSPPKQISGYAPDCQSKLSVCPSVCLSVTLRYRDHIGWISAKIISRLISLTISLSVECRPQHMDLLLREHPQILAGIEVG